MNTKIKITELDHLPEEKRTELNNWIADLGYRAAMEKVRTEWSCEITYNKIYRYYRRVLDKKVLDPENKLTMPEFIAYQNGEPTRHHELTHLNVQKRACELSQSPDNSASMLVTLMRIANNPIQLQLNQRRMALAEETAALKREELDWKKSTRTEPKSHSALSTQNSLTSSGPSASDPLGGMTVAQFIQSIPPKPLPNRSGQSGSDPVAARRETAADIAPSSSTNQTGPRTSSSAAPANADGIPSAQQQTEKSSILNHTNSSISATIAALEASVSPRPIYQPFRIRRYTPPTEGHRLDHMRRRYLSFLKRETQSSTPSDDSWRSECPCGNPSPCHHHGALPNRVNEMDPCSAEFIEELIKRGIPYTDPIPTSARSP